MGSTALLDTLATELKAQGRDPYLIPVGGSNPVGTWGYLEFVQELAAQQEELVRGGAAPFTDIIMVS